MQLTQKELRNERVEQVEEARTVEVAEVVHVAVLVGRYDTQPVAHVVLLKEFACEVLDISAGRQKAHCNCSITCLIVDESGPLRHGDVGGDCDFGAVHVDFDLVV